LPAAASSGVVVGVVLSAVVVVVVVNVVVDVVVGFGSPLPPPRAAAMLSAQPMPRW
jgi:hypothetical protein